MIKINLIPKEKRKGKPLLLYAFLFLLALNLSLFSTMYYNGKRAIADYEAKIEAKKQDMARLEPIYREYLAIEKEKAQIQQKIDVLEKIQEGRALPVRILYDIAHALQDAIWLRQIKKQQDRIEIEGFSNQTEFISDFAEALAKIPYMRSVELKTVQEVQELGMTVKKFSLEALIGS
jgi:type IV pilus assembly protein PilN